MRVVKGDFVCFVESVDSRRIAFETCLIVVDFKEITLQLFQLVENWQSCDWHPKL